MVLECVEPGKNGSQPKLSQPVISVVIPALNEEAGIAKTVSAIPRDELEALGYDLQVLVVDNGSTDKTSDLAKEAGAHIVFEPRRGYGRAYKTGFAHASGDIIATADADLTYPVESLPHLVTLIEKENLDFITTDRYAYMEKGAMSRRNKIGNFILSLTTRLLFRIPIRDSQSGMWVFKRDILPGMELKADSMAFSQELKIEACRFGNCKWKEVPIQYRARVGEVKLRVWKDGFGNLIHLVQKSLTRRNLPQTNIRAGLVRVAQMLSL